GPPPHLHSFPTRRSSDLPTLSRPQLGQAIITGPRSRRPSALRISKAVLTSSTGSAVSDTRTVSPIPSTSSAPIPTALLIEPEYRSEEHTSELQSPYDLVC